MSPRSQPSRLRIARPSALIVLCVFIVSCASGGDTAPATLDEALRSPVTSDFNLADTPEELGSMSEVVTIATLIDVEDGRYFGEIAGEPEGVHLNLVFETGQAEVYFVQIPRSMDSSVEALRPLFPIGSQNIIFLIPNDDPVSDGWFNVRDDGNEWFFTNPQGWISADSQDRTIWPLLGLPTSRLSHWHQPRDLSQNGSRNSALEP